MKAVAYSDKDLLLSLKRLCTEKNCFRDARQEGEVWEHYRDTMKMVDEELAKDTMPDADKLEAIVSNLLLVINNVAVYLDDESKAHQKKAISFVTMDINYAKACRFLDESTKVTAHYKAAKAKRKNAEQADAPKRRKIVRILKRFLLILLAIGFLIFLSGFLVSALPSQSKSENIFIKIVNWYKYDLKKEVMPVSFAEKWIHLSQDIGCVTLSVTGIWIIQTITLKLLQIPLRRKREHLYQEWNDYQILCAVFETASSQMNELEW